MLYNITTTSDKIIALRVKPMDYVTNGTDTGRYFGTTKRGTHVVAWGDKRDDYETAEKLIKYLTNHQ